MSAATAEAFKAILATLQSDAEKEKYKRYFKTGEGDYAQGDIFMGVRMGKVFDTAKQFIDMEPSEIEILLESDIHEHRAGAVSIMAKQYRAKKTTEERREELYALYLRRHDRINNWDLVDLGAWNVVGEHLVERPRDILYQLARSEVIWERRTAMLATFAFIRRKQFDDALAIAEILLHDPQDLIHKACGWMLRSIGADTPQLLAFLDRYAAEMPRTMLRATLENFDPDSRAKYMAARRR